MKVKELIDLLNRYENKETELYLKLISNDGSEEDDDANDVDLKCVGEIYSGGLEHPKPFVEIGFQLESKSFYMEAKIKVFIRKSNWYEFKSDEQYNTRIEMLSGNKEQDILDQLYVKNRRADASLYSVFTDESWEAKYKGVVGF